MKKIIKRLLIILLSLLAVIAIVVGLFFFHMVYGNWWDRPSLDADIITEIKIYEGHFRVPGQSPVLTLDGKSEDTKQIINTINKGWYYWQPVKLGSGYQFDVFYSDSTEGHIYIGSDIVSIRSPESDGLKKYRVYKQVRPIVDDIIKRNPNQSTHSITGSAGSE